MCTKEISFWLLGKQQQFKLLIAKSETLKAQRWEFKGGGEVSVLIFLYRVTGSNVMHAIEY